MPNKQEYNIVEQHNAISTQGRPSSNNAVDGATVTKRINKNFLLLPCFLKPLLGNLEPFKFQKDLQSWQLQLASLTTELLKSSAKFGFGIITYPSSLLAFLPLSVCSSVKENQGSSNEKSAAVKQHQQSLWEKKDKKGHILPQSSSGFYLEFRS